MVCGSPGLPFLGREPLLPKGIGDLVSCESPGLPFFWGVSPSCRKALVTNHVKAECVGDSSRGVSPSCRKALVTAEARMRVQRKGHLGREPLLPKGIGDT